MSKSLLTVLFFVFYNSIASATTYYVSSGGSDSNNGTSQATAWQTLTKVNSVTFSAGDHILFRRGDTFYGSIKIKQSGTSTSPIVFGDYGSGAKPVISGFTNVSSWTNLGSNIWESTSAVSTLSYTNMVTVNGVNTPMGRTPNSGYYTYQSHVGSTSITSSDLTGSPNWTGAEVAMFVNRYTLGRNPITAQSGGTLTYTSTTLDAVNSDNQRFIIQNDARTLDQQNEWYYNPSTKKIKIYSTSTPSNVRISTVDTLIYINGYNYISFSNIAFQGSNSRCIEFINAKHINLDGCDMAYHGQIAVHNDYGGAATGFTANRCSFTEINGSAINLSGDADAVTVQNSTLNNIGFIFGSGERNGVGYSAIRTTGANSLFRNNVVSNIGYVGIEFRGNNSIVDSNFVSNFCATLSDGGGIYTYNGSQATFTGRVVKNNILLNSPLGVGVYMDDFSNGLNVYNNSISGCETGLYLHGVTNSTVHNNTMYNNSYAQLQMAEESGELFSSISVTNNILVSRASTQSTLVVFLRTLSMNATLDSNYYARPIDDNQTIAVQIASPYSYTFYTLAGWQALLSKDSHSHKSPKTITDLNDLVFEYNTTTSSAVTSLDANYIDVAGTSYNGSITLAPFSSAVLIKDDHLFAMVKSPNIISDITRVAAYPNPFASSIKVSITGKAGPFNLSLVDALGRILWTKSRSKNTGTYQEIINTSSIGKGIYFLRVTLNNKSSIIKLVK